MIAQRAPGLVDIVISSDNRIAVDQIITEWSRAQAAAHRQPGQIGGPISIFPTVANELNGKLRLIGVPEAVLPLLKARGIRFEMGNHGGVQRFVGQPLSR